VAHTERDIDRLYQLPLSEFTDARNDLAKGVPADRKAIAALQKPNVAAWAVNQLYWRERQAYNALVTAAEGLRSAHVTRFSGGRADVSRAEEKHAEALKAATARIRQVLQEAGEAASASTMNAVGETLRALPAEGAAGRLSRPLKPPGFEALARVLTPGTPSTRSATVLPFSSKPDSKARTRPGRGAESAAAAKKRDAEAARQEARARARAAAKAAADLDAARAAERAAQAALARARATLAKAERARQALALRLDAAARDVQKQNDDIRERLRVAADASSEREKLEARLKMLRP
jgi:hypothetical protein